MKRQDIRLLVYARQGDVVARLEVARRYLLGGAGFSRHVALGLEYLAHPSVADRLEAAVVVAACLPLHEILVHRQEAALSRAAASGHAGAQLKLALWSAIRQGRLHDDDGLFAAAAAQGEAVAQWAHALLSESPAARTAGASTPESPLQTFLQALARRLPAGAAFDTVSLTLEAARLAARSDDPERLARCLDNAIRAAARPAATGVSAELAELLMMAVQRGQGLGGAGSVALEGIDPAIRFDESALPPTINGGQPIELPILLGDAQTPVEDLYGIAFSVFVDPQFVDTDDMEFNFSELSWANPDNDRVSLFKKVSNERIDVAWVRTDHNQRDGYGRIGTADFIIIIDVIDLQQDFMMRIDSVKMIDKFGNQTAVAGDTIMLHFSPDGQVTAAPESRDADIRISPNPAMRQLQISSPEPIEQVTIVNTLGQPVLRETANDNSLNLLLPELPSGIYLLEIRTAGGTVIQKIRIQQ